MFGGRGAIGSAIVEAATRDGFAVTATTRQPHDGGETTATWIAVDPCAADFDPAVLDAGGPYDAVCWSQGANQNDSIYGFDLASHEALYRANVVFILATLNLLLTRKLLAEPARLCVVSSIWQNIARQNKMSYGITKAALQGLVLSAATDLAKDGHLVNAVLPGVLDTPMTRRNLAPPQLDAVSSATLFGRLPSVESVVELVLFLCSDRNAGLTGQFITADLGFSNVRII